MIDPSVMDEVARQQATLLELFARDNRDFDQTVAHLLTENGRVLQIARCSLWSLHGEGDDATIRLEALVDTAHPGPAPSLAIAATTAPRYFAALTRGQVIAADDARTDPRTNEFAGGYLEDHGITSMLDVPIFVAGKIVAVLCHEHVGPRRTFSSSEVQFAVSIGQLLSLAIEAHRRGLAERALARSESRLRAVIESALDAVITTDEHGSIEGWNPQAERLFGWREVEVLGRPIATIAAEESASVLRAGERDPRRVELTARDRDGRTFLAEASLAPIALDDNRHGTAAFVRDITERKRLEEELRHQAFHDPLTALPNRAFFLRLVTRELGLATRSADHRFALLFIDLDGFKLINDSLGHEAGDKLLVEIARRLTACMRTTDVAARLGGDEFTILASPIKADGDAITIAERVADALRAPMAIGTHEVVPSASIGILLSDPAYHSADEMMRDADAAMYRAKERGKARYELFDRDIHTQHMARLQLETDLRYAIDREQLRLYYQPIVEIATGRIVSVEALLRWQRTPETLVLPGEFIRVAEETRLINRIGRWVLDGAIAQAAAWSARFGRPISVSVNIARPQFFQSDLPAFVQETLTRHGLPPEQLRIELSERVLQRDPAAISAALRALPGKKCIDDFGTGLSSLSALPELHIQAVKIDRSFVGRIDDFKELVRAIAALAHNLRMEVMVEGVETAELLSLLRELGCDLAQGFWFSPAVSAEALEAMLVSGG